MALVKRSLTNNSSFLAHKRVCYSSSSDDETKSRAGFYSSDDDDEHVNSISAPLSGRRMSLPLRRGSFVCKPSHSRKNSSDFCKAPEAIKKLVCDSDNDNSFALKNCAANDHDFSVGNNINSNNNAASPARREFVASSSDLSARLRCFDYLVGAIDEAWARFCDATSYADYNTESDNDESANNNKNDDDDYYDDDDKDYKSDGTELTDYEYNSYAKNPPVSAAAPSSSPYRQHQRHFSISNNNEASLHSASPESAKMQSLKYRLIRAKTYLQDFVESEDSNDAKLFWARWDLIKYATIELVEDDDDDDLVEDTIEDLEKGRCF